MSHPMSSWKMSAAGAEKILRCPKAKESAEAQAESEEDSYVSYVNVYEELTADEGSQA